MSEEEIARKFSEQIQKDLDRLAFGGDLASTSSEVAPTAFTQQMLDDLIAKFPAPLPKASIHIVDQLDGIMEINANGEKQFWMDGSHWAHIEMMVVHTYNPFGNGVPVFDHRKPPPEEESEAPHA